MTTTRRVPCAGMTGRVTGPARWYCYQLVTMELHTSIVFLVYHS